MSDALVNVLLQQIEYKVEETPSGTWRRFVYPSGAAYAEYRSHGKWGDLPLVHITLGRSPETGRFVTARGGIAIGRFARGGIAIGIVARGYVAIGLLAFGLIAVGLVGMGLLLGVGQVALGLASVGQFAAGVFFALGQLAVGHVAIGQIAYGHYVLAQQGYGDFVWDARAVDPAAHKFFLSLVGK